MNRIVATFRQNKKWDNQKKFKILRFSTQVEINVVCIFQQIFKICNLAARIIKSLQTFSQRQDSTQVEIKLYFNYII